MGRVRFSGENSGRGPKKIENHSSNGLGHIDFTIKTISVIIVAFAYMFYYYYVHVRVVNELTYENDDDKSIFI